MRFRFLVPIFLIFSSACGEDIVETGELRSSVTGALRDSRLRTIRDRAATRGLSNGLLLAGIADAETNLAHCYSEATYHCPGPYSAECGGAVLAGSGDGACNLLQGGLGFFQFDAGTHSQTLAREGNRILTVQGSTDAAVDFVVAMVRSSIYISGVSTQADALAWMNAVRVDGPRWSAWIDTVTHYYNGCPRATCGVYTDRYRKYDGFTRSLLSEKGSTFWYGGSSGPRCDNNVPLNGTACAAQNEAREFLCVAPGTANQWQERACPGGELCIGDRCQPVGCGNFLDLTTCNANSAACAWYACSNSCWPRGTPIATACPAPLSAPTQLTPGYLTVTVPSLTLGWSAVSGASSYEVQFHWWDTSTGQWQYYFTWNNIGANAFTVWPAYNHKTYLWRVRACGGGSCSPWSGYSQFHFANP